MSITVVCACGARFEVQDQSAGQMVECPKCEEPARAGRSTEVPVRTSHLAMGSLMLALVGGLPFAIAISALAHSGRNLSVPTTILVVLTPLVPFLSILLAVAGYLGIRRSGGALRGKGFATGGIVTAAVFALFGGLLIVQQGEAIELLREHLSSDRVRYDGELKKINHVDGYSIKRPNRKWGVSTTEYQIETGMSGFTLMRPSRKLMVQVQVHRHINREFHPHLAGASEELQRELYARLGLEARRPGGFRDGTRGEWQDIQAVQKPTVVRQNEWIYETEHLFIGTRNRSSGPRNIREQRRAIVRLVVTRDRAFEIWAIAPSDTFAEHERELRGILDTFEVLSDAWRD